MLHHIQRGHKHSWSRLCLHAVASVVSDSPRPHGLQPTRLLRHGILQERVLEWGAIAFSCEVPRGVKLTDIESRMCLPGAVRKEK